MSILKRIWAPVLMVCALVAAIVYYNVSVRSFEGNLAKEQEQMQELNDAITALKAEQSSARSTALSGATNLDYKRISRDFEVGRDILAHVGTWDSWKTYDASRTELMEKYGLSDDDQIVVELMPEVMNDTRFSEDGINTIDKQGLNMKTSSVEVYLVGMDKNSYSYLAEGILETKWDGRTASQRAMVMYSCDVNGNVSNITGTMVN